MNHYIRSVFDPFRFTLQHIYMFQVIKHVMVCVSTCQATQVFWFCCASPESKPTQPSTGPTNIDGCNRDTSTKSPNLYSPPLLGMDVNGSWSNPELKYSILPSRHDILYSFNKVQ